MAAGGCFEHKSSSKAPLHYLHTTCLSAKQQKDTGSDVLVNIVEHLAAKYPAIFLWNWIGLLEGRNLRDKYLKTWASNAKTTCMAMALVRLSLWKWSFKLKFVWSLNIHCFYQKHRALRLKLHAPNKALSNMYYLTRQVHWGHSYLQQCLGGRGYLDLHHPRQDYCSHVM